MGASGLGPLLVREGFLTERDWRIIAKTAGSSSWSVAKGVLAAGLLEQDELVALLAERTNFKVASKAILKKIDPALFSRIGTGLCLQLEILPISLEKNRLIIAVLDPLDRGTVHQMEFFTHYKIVPLIASYSLIRAGLRLIKPDFELSPSTLEYFLSNHVISALAYQKVQDNIRKGGTAADPVAPKKKEQTEKFSYAEDIYEELDSDILDDNYDDNPVDAAFSSVQDQASSASGEAGFSATKSSKPSLDWDSPGEVSYTSNEGQEDLLDLDETSGTPVAQESVDQVPGDLMAESSIDAPSSEDAGIQLEGMDDIMIEDGGGADAPVAMEEIPMDGMDELISDGAASADTGIADNADDLGIEEEDASAAQAEASDEDGDLIASQNSAEELIADALDPMEDMLADDAGPTSDQDELDDLLADDPTPTGSGEPAEKSEGFGDLTNEASVDGETQHGEGEDLLTDHETKDIQENDGLELDSLDFDGELNADELMPEEKMDALLSGDDEAFTTDTPSAEEEGENDLLVMEDVMINDDLEENNATITAGDDSAVEVEDIVMPAEAEVEALVSSDELDIGLASDDAELMVDGGDSADPQSTLGTDEDVMAEMALAAGIVDETDAACVEEEIEGTEASFESGEDLNALSASDDEMILSEDSTLETDLDPPDINIEREPAASANEASLDNVDIDGLLADESVGKLDEINIIQENHDEKSLLQRRPLVVEALDAPPDEADPLADMDDFVMEDAAPEEDEAAMAEEHSVFDQVDLSSAISEDDALIEESGMQVARSVAEPVRAGAASQEGEVRRARTMARLNHGLIKLGLAASADSLRQITVESIGSSMPSGMLLQIIKGKQEPFVAWRQGTPGETEILTQQLDKLLCREISLKADKIKSDEWLTVNYPHSDIKELFAEGESLCMTAVNGPSGKNLILIGQSDGDVTDHKGIREAITTFVRYLDNKI